MKFKNKNKADIIKMKYTILFRKVSLKVRNTIEKTFGI
ncbi:hypothetical protein LEP1GSC066_3261 [Leptospira sp. serovar Kenya str. Sh9]|nr:hypothetical protein LEP1GSC101_2847 [Leptospira borgpetersenii str. UI 09149]EMK12366.1 hypothetical protein LEP1GSC066_3261 [Leptospira sp. serovar Kenya str. Sh9]EMN11331.1 hypothetical protein LEP1GSC055_0919 [Leptospira borgpetersenii str. Brem 307]EMN58211.1 hypothetical protein LEP1GSC090_3696 [Leptospira borgpetersenii serovar Javanica str. MK146]